MENGWKKLATLTFYLDEENDGSTGDSSAEGRVGLNEYEIVIRPNADKNLSQKLGMAGTIQPSIIAHELGHFISEVTKDPAHTPLAKYLMGPLPAEVNAWKRAEEIGVPIDSEIRKKALETYMKEYGR